MGYSWKEFEVAARIAFLPAVIFSVVSFSLYLIICWKVDKKKDDNSLSEEEVMRRLEEREEKKGEIGEIFVLARDADQKNDKKTAIKLYVKFLSEYKDMKESLIPPEVLVSLERLGVLCKQFRLYELSLKFAQARKFLLEHALAGNVNSEKPGIYQHAEVLRNMSNIMLREGEMELATEYANKAMDLDMPEEEENEKNVSQFLKAFSELGKRTYEDNLKQYEERRTELKKDL